MAGKGAGDVTSGGVKELENDANVTLPTVSVVKVEGQDGTSADPVLTESRPSALGRHQSFSLSIPTAMADIGWGRSNDARTISGRTGIGNGWGPYAHHPPNWSPDQ